MANRCNAELCPYWDGDGCPCRAFGIAPPSVDDDWMSLPSASYYREVRTAERDER